MNYSAGLLTWNNLQISEHLRSLTKSPPQRHEYLFFYWDCLPGWTSLPLDGLGISSPRAELWPIRSSDGSEEQIRSRFVDSDANLTPLSSFSFASMRCMAAVRRISILFSSCLCLEVCCCSFRLASWQNSTLQSVVSWQWRAWSRHSLAIVWQLVQPRILLGHPWTWTIAAFSLSHRGSLHVASSQCVACSSIWTPLLTALSFASDFIASKFALSIFSVSCSWPIVW